MRSFTDYKILLWDFDGVIIDSMPIRTRGFEQVLCNFPSDQVQQLITFHQQNGGLSRYIKFKYFFEKIRNESVSEEMISEYANRFSLIMRDVLTNKELLIQDTIDFIRLNSSKFAMHIVSGSDEVELKFLCQKLDIQQFFISVHGSPAPKDQLIQNLLDSFKYDRSETAFIGDSLNDLSAASIAKIDFIGYNNEAIRNVSPAYVSSFCNAS